MEVLLSGAPPLGVATSDPSPLEPLSPEDPPSTGTSSKKATGENVLSKNDRSKPSDSERPPPMRYFAQQIENGSPSQQTLACRHTPYNLQETNQAPTKTSVRPLWFCGKARCPLETEFFNYNGFNGSVKIIQRIPFTFYHFYIFRQLREHEISPRSNSCGYLLHNCYIFRIIYRDAQPRHGTNRIGPLSTPRTPRDTPHVLQTWQQAPLRHRAA